MSEYVLFIEVIMLACVLAGGICASYFDIVQRRVPNSLTYFILILGVVGQILMVAVGVTTPTVVTMTILVGLVVAFGLTILRMWGPGHAKLFWAMSVALPPSLVPWKGVLEIDGPVFAVLTPAVLGYLVAYILGRIPTFRPECFPKRMEVCEAFLGFGAILGLFLGVIYLVIGRPVGFLESSAALFVGYKLLTRIIHKNTVALVQMVVSP